KASDVSISLIKNAAEMELIVSDNGIGLSADRLPLRHLESRARKFGGELTVDSAPQKGTKINLRFTPYSDV
ncbi:MAG: histidine kinase, partial [Opitutales bacterium]